MSNWDLMTSQYLMLVGLGSIGFAWLTAFLKGHRHPGLQQVFAAIFVQAFGAFLLSFSSANLPISLFLALIILLAVAWMVRSANTFKAQNT